VRARATPQTPQWVADRFVHRQVTAAMTNWMNRLLRWASGERANTAARASADGADGDTATAAADAVPVHGAGLAAAQAGESAQTADLEVAFFEWLLGEASAGVPVDAVAEQRVLAFVDEVLHSDEMRENLLPRARSVIPELLHSLRDENQSTRALSARVAHDPNLVVEVIHLANSVWYRADKKVVDLMQAISRLGTEGLRRAIARVLLKPIFDAQGDPLLGRATQRLWQHSELKASLCLQQAASAGLDPFGSYLAGLMHNVGWTAAFRAIDRSPGGAPTRFSPDFINALAPRRDRLFATLVRTWELSDSLTDLADEVLRVGFANAKSPLAQLLLYADRTSSQQLLQPRAMPAGQAREPRTDSTGV